MTVLITGATSFLGRAVIAELQKRGQEVLAFRHGIEPEKLPADLSGKQPVLIHFGWAGTKSAERLDERIQAYNIAQSVEHLQTAKKLGCRRFLFAGSQAEYSLSSAYGRAKKEFGLQAAESCAEDSRNGKQTLEFLHLRIFSVYGPGDRENSLISSLIRAKKEGKDFELGPCTQLWNFLFIDDLAGIIADLAERTERTEGIVDIGGKDTRVLKSFVEEAWEEAGKEFGNSSGSLFFGVRENNAEGAADLCPDLTRLNTLLPVREHSFAEGIRQTCRKSM